MIRSFLAAATLLLAAGCVPAPAPAPPAVEAGKGPVCRIGPDGAAPAGVYRTADRGIGGTGRPAARLSDRGMGGTGQVADRGMGGTGQVADRGMGGTGQVADRGMGGTGRMADRGMGGTGQMADRGLGGTGRQADRGIGGTGIVGIVTGFASICVDGREVGLDARAPVDADGVTAGTDALRAGQVVAITAGPDGFASKISIRHEVSGQVEAVLSADPGLFLVAGQRVRTTARTIGQAVVRAGAWVSVSGMRGPDGDVIASRIDPRAAGKTIVHGPLIAADGVRSVGDLTLNAGDGVERFAGTFVFVTGTYAAGTLSPDYVGADLLLTDPPAYFGPAANSLVLQAHVSAAGGDVVLNGGFHAPFAPGVRPPAGLRGPVVISIDPLPGGGLAVTGIDPAPRVVDGGALGGPAAGQGDGAHGGDPKFGHPDLKTGAGPGAGRPVLQPGSPVPGASGGAAGARIGPVPVAGLKAPAPKVKLSH